MPRDRRLRDDDEDEDDRPARKRRRVEEDDEDEEPRPKRKPRASEDDEDEPPRRVKPRVVDDEDEDEEEEERPRRKKKKKKPAGMNKGLLFGLIGGGVALVLVVVLLIVFLGGSSPKSVVERAMKAARNGDFGTMYDSMSAPIQKRIADGARQQASRDPNLRQFQSLGDRELVVAVSKEKEKTGTNPFKAQGEATILGETITGDTATVRVRNPNGREESIPMVKENGRWKIAGL